MFELVFIGAGPHCLTTLLRLLEPHPDPSVDAAYRKATPKAKVLGYWQWQRSCPNYRASMTAWLRSNVAIIDPSGDWLTRWKQQFATLGINHLRSTTAVHPDPLDTYALATYASSLPGQHGTDRLAELLPLKHIQKSEHFRGPFAVPGAQLFEDFCEDLIHRYCLEGCVTRDKVVQLIPVYAQKGCTADTTACSCNTAASSNTASPASNTSSAVDHWQVQLASGMQLLTKRVIVGIGSTNMPRIPECLQHLHPVDVPESISSSSGFKSSCSSSCCMGRSNLPTTETQYCKGATAQEDSIDTSSINSSSSRSSSSSVSSESTAQDTANSSSADDNESSRGGGAAASSNVIAMGLPSTVVSLMQQSMEPSASEALAHAAAADLRDSQYREAAPTDAEVDSNSISMSICCSNDDCDGACSGSSGWTWDSSATASRGIDTWSNASSPSSPRTPSSCCNATDAELCWQEVGTAAASGQAVQTCTQPASAAATASQAGMSASARDPAGNPPYAGSESRAATGVAASTAQPTAAGASLEVAPADGAYPIGRMMHAWQLVHASSAAAVAPGVNTESKRDSMAGIAQGDSANGGNSSSNSTGNPRMATAVQLLQKQGLVQPGESVLIIGGGLTSAHLVSLAVAGSATCAGGCCASGSRSSSRSSGNSSSNSGSRVMMSMGTASEAAAVAGTSGQPGSFEGQQIMCNVTLLLRGSQRVKQFDVDTPWMGRQRKVKLQAEFRQIKGWQQRLKLMKRVLQGGSLPPEAAAGLQQLQQRGLVEVMEYAEVLAAEWNWQQQQWDVWLQDGGVLHADRLWLATGSSVSAESEPLLASLLQQMPIPVAAGLPAIQPNLEWRPGSGLYLLGAYAALQLGPGALNLAGAKTASVILEQQLGKVLPRLPCAAGTKDVGSHAGKKAASIKQVQR